MSVLFSNDRSWLANSWISRGFFDDALRFAVPTSQLISDLQFCKDADVDTLDMRNVDATSLRDFRDLVGDVIKYNEDLRGTNFEDPESFAFYNAKLRELKAIVDEVLKH